MALLIGLDLGTTTLKAIAYDPQTGKVIAQASCPTPTDHPEPEASQHDPQVLWQAAAGCLRKLRQQTGSLPIAGLAISSLAEAGLPLDANGDPLYPIVAWFDRRCLPQAQSWYRHFSLDTLHAITGQTFNTSFGANKWLWLRENHPEVCEKTARWLSFSDYILYRLTGEQATDYSIASRTLLFDQHTLDWSTELMGFAGLRRDQLPQAYPGGTQVGKITPQAAEESGIPAGTPCSLGGHDHLCASFLVGASQPGVVVDSTGTAEAVVMVAPKFFSQPGMAARSLACYAHVVPGQTILKGGTKAAGGAIDWLGRILTGKDGKSEKLPYAELESLARQGVGRRAGPLWLPHWIGSGSPVGDALSRAAVTGLTMEDGAGDLLRGLLESLAFWLRQNVDDMEKLTCTRVERVILVGGATRLELLSQLKADVLDRPVSLVDIPEASATGAALLAGIGAGLFTNPADALASLHSNPHQIRPDPGRAAWYERIYQEAYLPFYTALKDINHTLGGIRPPNQPV